MDVWVLGLFADRSKIAESRGLVSIPVAVSSAEVEQQVAAWNTLLSGKAKAVCSAIC